MSSEQTKTRILDTTWKLLEKRIEKNRMSDIAKAVGISRQALYLHYPTRAELLIATTKHIDTVKKVNQRLELSRTAGSGIERLHFFIKAWGGYIPEIHGISVALRNMRKNDKAAAEAWDDRMQAVRHGCQAAVVAIAKDGKLKFDLSEQIATDILWTLLTIENWEKLVINCGWLQSAYEEKMIELAEIAILET
ncbi:MAG: TetR/AcrR family transcriptional regulator [Amylibacter sp.]|jgi:AcrR family transcriptional regulator|nr:TetR/AcrR family transcriptional regulator [Amylibacter sp.]|tara:strand:- start:80 stop:658 length:579 start_codon:yes stop_codon:yes gene_type:complete